MERGGGKPPDVEGGKHAIISLVQPLVILQDLVHQELIGLLYVDVLLAAGLKPLAEMGVRKNCPKIVQRCMMLFAPGAAQLIAL